MSEFCGSWRLVKNENFDGYLKELGINVVLRKLAAITVPTLVISADGKEEEDGVGEKSNWTYRTETPVRSVNAYFKLGEEFVETTIDNRKVRSVFTIEEVEEEKGEADDGMTRRKKKKELVQLQTDKEGRRSRIVRVLRKEEEGEFMDISMEVNGVVAGAVFKRIK